MLPISYGDIVAPMPHIENTPKQSGLPTASRAAFVCCLSSWGGPSSTPTPQMEIQQVNKVGGTSGGQKRGAPGAIASRSPVGRAGVIPRTNIETPLSHSVLGETGEHPVGWVPRRVRVRRVGSTKNTCVGFLSEYWRARGAGVPVFGSRVCTRH